MYLKRGLFAIQVVAELLLGLVFSLWAALTVPGTFLSIHPYSEENMYVFVQCLSSQLLTYVLLMV